MQNKKAVIWVLLGVTTIAFLFGIRRIANPLGAPGDAGRGWGQGHAVAVIYLEGVITSGGQGGLFTTLTGADPIIQKLNQAKNDPDVGAVVLRINSPGGSPAASQEIYNAALRLREAGKPLVVSIADVAASGGYLVACAADEILANPASVTGSIGVIIEVTNYVELYEKLGIGSEVIKSGEHKDMGSAARTLNEEERLILQSVVDDIHEQFIDVVSQGRNLSREEVDALADGRIFTGRQALERGLVDRLGDSYDAVELAGELAGIPGRPRIKKMGRTTTLQRLFGTGGIHFPGIGLWPFNTAGGSLLMPR